MAKLAELKKIAHGIAEQFGPSCEVVIHDMRGGDLDKTLVYIENGELSNRKLGDGLSPEKAATVEINYDLVDRYSYLTKTKDNRVFKSTTMYIDDEDGVLSYVLCINLDITELISAQSAFNNIVGTVTAHPIESEHGVTSVEALLEDLIEQTERMIGKPAVAMSKSERMKAIKYLNDAGAFLISKSSDRVCEHFGVSKFTLYSDINVAKKS